MKKIIVDPTSNRAKVNQLFGLGTSYSKAIKNGKKTILDGAYAKAKSIGLSPIQQSNNSSVNTTNNSNLGRE